MGRWPMRALLFDVYGTLVDVHGIATAADELFPGQGAALSALWRTRQIDYTRLRTLSGRHADFEVVTADALDFASDKLGLTLTPAARADLLERYLTLPAFPDVAPALKALRGGGMTLGVLSNGTPRMLAEALGAAGIRSDLDHVLSIEAAGRYKTAPEAYRLGPAALGLPAGEIGFVSSNGWEVAGAGWFGFATFWVNRTGEPLERLGIAPQGTGRTLDDLVTWVPAR